MQITTDASFAPQTACSQVHQPDGSTQMDRLLGLFVMAVLPALFWTAMIALIAPMLGFTLSAAWLAGIGLGIGAFLAGVCCTLTSRWS